MCDYSLFRHFRAFPVRENPRIYAIQRYLFSFTRPGIKVKFRPVFIVIYIRNGNIEIRISRVSRDFFWNTLYRSVQHSEDT